MVQEILQNIMLKYPELQFGHNCSNCAQYGWETSKHMYLCLNCCIGLLNNFKYYEDNRKEIFLYTEEFFTIKNKLTDYLLNEPELKEEIEEIKESFNRM